MELGVQWGGHDDVAHAVPPLGRLLALLGPRCLQSQSALGGTGAHLQAEKRHTNMGARRKLDPANYANKTSRYLRPWARRIRGPPAHPRAHLTSADALVPAPFGMSRRSVRCLQRVRRLPWRLPWRGAGRRQLLEGSSELLQRVLVAEGLVAGWEWV